MEKIIYALWKHDSQSGDEFREILLTQLAPALRCETTHNMRLCVSDSDVSPAASYRIENAKPVADAILSLWLDSSVYRESIETEIAKHTTRFAGYLVTESEPLINATHPPKQGERTVGMNQVVFLQKPDRLTFQEWIEIWHGSHTKIAIDTQSTFGYRQNVVARAVTENAPPCDAIVEENFPEAAIYGREAFYDAGDDAQLLQQRETQMMESCARFIDFDKIDCIPMSEYVIG
ncbi:hypothetical protein [Litorivivens sp.]|uniref:hypothetical protein n=2 Tax=Litorivivens sp. TaxID=2020868 RepID=UPI003567C695